MAIINNSGLPDAIAGMSISTSNKLLDKSPTITSAGVGEIPLNISSPDHSLNYTSGTQAAQFSVSYGLVQAITYVAISGHTAAGLIGATIELYNDITLIQTVTISRNNNIMFTFDEMTFTDLIVKFVTSQSTQQVTVSFIAAGKHINISTGEQSGYSRNWLVRHTQESVTTNLLSAPIGTTQKSKPLKGSLSLPNELAAFIEQEWQDFIDFSYEQPFFIKEIEAKPESTYICFNPKHSIKAHPQTRVLDAVTLGFTAYNGL